MDVDREKLRNNLMSIVGVDDANDPRWNEVLFNRIQSYQEEAQNLNDYCHNRLRPLEKELMYALISTVRPPFSGNVNRAINKLFYELGYKDYAEDSRRPRNCWEYYWRRRRM